MVNQILLAYLQENKEKYPLEDLKKKILSKGYLESDFNEALRLLESPVAKTPPTKQSSPATLFQPPSQVQKTKSSPPETNASKEKGSFPFRPKLFTASTGNSALPGIHLKKTPWMKFAGITGIVFLAFWTALFVLNFIAFDLSGIFEGALAYVFIGVVGLFVLLDFLYLFGFFKMGGKVHGKLLKISSLSKMALMVLLTLFVLFVALTGDLSNSLANSNEGIFNAIPTYLIFLAAGILLLGLVLEYLLSIGLLKARWDIPFARSAGVLGLVLSGVITLLLGTVVYLTFNVALLESFFSNQTMDFIVRGTLIALSGLFLVLLLLRSLSLIKGSSSYERPSFQQKGVPKKIL